MPDHGPDVSFDGERALAEARAVAGDSILVFATFTDEGFELLSVAEQIERQYEEGDADFDDVAEELHGYEQLDFLESERFDDLLPTVESVHGFATFTDLGVITRVVNEQREGVYVTVAPGTNVTELVAALRPIVCGEAES